MTFHWTADQKTEFTRMWNDGVPVETIERHFDCSQSTIDGLRKRQGLNPRQSSGWSDAEVISLTERWGRGESASQIAMHLNNRSRASVCGMARRMKLSARVSPANFNTASRVLRPRRKLKAPKVAPVAKTQPPKPGPQNKPAAVFGKVNTISDAEAIEKHRVAFAAAGAKVAAGFDAAANDDAISLLDRKRYQCAWPVGAPDRPANQMCCGRPVPADANPTIASYCARHGQAAISRSMLSGKPGAKVYERSLRRFYS